MIPSEIISLAIKGGWKDTVLEQMSVTSWHVAALDADFWQALGKALGWNPTPLRQYDLGDRAVSEWRRNALTFYDLVLTGGNTNAFWEQLLTDKK